MNRTLVFIKGVAAGALGTLVGGAAGLYVLSRLGDQIPQALLGLAVFSRLRWVMLFQCHENSAKFSIGWMRQAEDAFQIVKPIR